MLCNHLSKYIHEIIFCADFFQFDIALIENLAHKVKPDINALSPGMIDLVLCQIDSTHAITVDFQKVLFDSQVIQ